MSDPTSKYVQESKPVESWSIVRDFSKFGPECPQYNRIKGKIIGSDDCLYLNVYSPVDESSQSAARKPVMVWIHGGLYATGSGDDMFYGPDYIIENDVILVTINYRLSVFGKFNFLTIPFRPVQHIPRTHHFFLHRRFSQFGGW